MTGVRAGIRRTRCGVRRSRARPIFDYDNPAADDLASPPRQGGQARCRAVCRPRSTSLGGPMQPESPPS